jgi:hypothetical protein
MVKSPNVEMAKRAKVAKAPSDLLITKQHQFSVNRRFGGKIWLLVKYYLLFTATLYNTSK